MPHHKHSNCPKSRKEIKGLQQTFNCDSGRLKFKPELENPTRKIIKFSSEFAIRETSSSHFLDLLSGPLSLKRLVRTRP